MSINYIVAISDYFCLYFYLIVYHAINSNASTYLVIVYTNMAFFGDYRLITNTIIVNVAQNGIDIFALV